MILQRIFAALLIQLLRQNLRAGPNAQAVQQCALLNHWRGWAGRSIRKRLEIHMGGQISHAGFHQRVARGVVPYGLKRVPFGAPVAVIHHNRRAAMGRNPLCHLRDDR